MNLFGIRWEKMTKWRGQKARNMFWNNIGKVLDLNYWYCIIKMKRKRKNCKLFLYIKTYRRNLLNPSKTEYKEETSFSMAERRANLRKQIEECKKMKERRVKEERESENKIIESEQKSIKEDQMKKTQSHILARNSARKDMENYSLQRKRKSVNSIY